MSTNLALELIDVVKAFGPSTVIRGANLQVRRGERHALIGPNGAGKSTLFHLISGLFPLTSGEIRLHDQVISGLEPHEINRRGLSRYTPLFAGSLVALYIAVEAPISGKSMNPARSFGPAAVGSLWQHFWIYLAAPPAGMLAASLLYPLAAGANSVACAKLYHHSDARCIFRCDFARLAGREPVGPRHDAARTLVRSA